MAENQYVNLTIQDDAIGVVTINNPPVNALCTPLMQELDRVLTETAGNDAIKVIIITGTGSVCFVAGADIKEINRIDTPERGKEMAKNGQDVINRIENMEKPVIAAINGLCLGGGNELAMACHIRIASDMAKFGQPEINLGIIPGFGGTQRLARLVGKAKATELILLGDMITAKEALAIGLLNKIVPPNAVIKTAMGMAKKIAKKGRLAVRDALFSINKGASVSLAEGLLIEAEAFGNICGTEDMKEGVSAFIEKRQPKFKDK